MFFKDFLKVFYLPAGAGGGQAGLGAAPEEEQGVLHQHRAARHGSGQNLAIV